MTTLGSMATFESALIALATFAARATVLLLGAWFATWVLRRGSAAMRHLVWSAAVAGVLLLPILSAVVPSVDIPMLTSPAPAVAASPAPQTPSEVAQVEATRPASSAAEDARISAQAPTPSAAAPVAPSSESLGAIRAWASPSRLLVVVWAALALLLLVRLAVANIRVANWHRTSEPVDDERWLALLRRLTRHYGITRPVVLERHGATDVPVTFGVVYPVVLLPADADEWDDEQRTTVLTHELAHVKRLDALTQLAGQAALGLLWFHPLMWMAVRRMRLEREHACDDFVLAAGARPSRYADDLLGFARGLARPTAPAAAALAMARRSELEGRLLAILDPAVTRGTLRRARARATLAAVVVLALPLAAFRPTSRTISTEPTRPETSSQRVASAPDTTHAPVVQQTRSGAPRATDAVDSSPAASALNMQSGAMPRVPGTASLISMPELKIALSFPALVQARTDTEPQKPIDVATLIDVTRAVKRMTADNEKGELLAMIAKRYVRNDALRDAYLDAVSTMTSDSEREKALLALMERDSLPLGATAMVLRSVSQMTSDASRGKVLKRISPAAFADSSVQRAYMDAMASMTSDMERGAALAALIKQRNLSVPMQLALLRATAPMTSDLERANVLLLFAERQGFADALVRRAYIKSAEGMTSDSDYRRVMAAVMK